ncbi:MAG: sulfatase-like hydrolase/transferase [Victivallales bacterium]|jgi:arylsulfatase A-like enzyme|nr:sulfatase-like hydrolase/transferase [Victivallales bacterium]
MKSPNIVLIMTDQQRADLTAREGYPLDTTPFLDSLARTGTDFARAYTSSPICAPARVSLFTGRYPSATRVRTNHNVADATYTQDLVGVLKEQGYCVGMSGKNHSHITGDRWDFSAHFSHGGGSGPDRTEEEIAFDQFLSGLQHRTHLEPTPFPVPCQGPYRAVTKAQEWIESLADTPFFLWLTFAEPHNPFQAPEPYYSMFPPESLPPCRGGEDALADKGYRWQWLRDAWDTAIHGYAGQLDRTRANYHGMLRLIDDQVKRFVSFLDEKGLREDTIIVFVSDHGDFVGEYGLIRKGPDLPECLTRIPLFFTGPGIVAGETAHQAHVSICDIMPTLCDALDVPLPDGVQGRSLWPLLTGQEFPPDEFSSIYAEHGYGGLTYTAEDDLDPVEEGALNPGCTFDCLNSWTQSGTLRMVRRDNWKLVFDMQGNGQLYNLADDPAELSNLYGQPAVAQIQSELQAELLKWLLRTQDPLPLPRRRYVFKGHPRNYWTDQDAE